MYKDYTCQGDALRTYTNEVWGTTRMSALSYPSYHGFRQNDGKSQQPKQERPGELLHNFDPYGGRYNFT